MLATHRKAHSKYELIGSHIRSTVEKELPPIMINSFGEAINVRGAVQLGNLDHKALTEAKRWEDSFQRPVDFHWHGGAPKYIYRHPKRFEIAVWYKELWLCGLALGRPTWSGNRMRLDFIEASPEKTPLKGVVAEIIILATEAYAVAIGAHEVRIMDPVNEKVRNHYLKIGDGYAFNSKDNYCYKVLR